MNGTKSAKKNKKGEPLAVTKEKISEETLWQITEIFQRFMEKQRQNPEKKIEEWLFEQLKEELPEKEENEILKITKKIADSVEFYERELEDFNRSMRAGITKESWFVEKLQDKAKGFSADYFGNILFEMNYELAMANQKMGCVILGIKDSKKIRKKQKVKWNSYNTQEIALELGREAKSQLVFWKKEVLCLEKHGALSASWYMEADKNNELKGAVAGTLKIAGEKKILPYGFYHLPTEWLVRIACMSVDNLKIISEMAGGERTMREVTEEMEKRILLLYASLDMRNRSSLCFYAPILGKITEAVVCDSMGEKVTKSAKIQDGIL